jgi:hypothetical protein
MLDPEHRNKETPMPRIHLAAPLVGLLLVTACADLRDEIEKIGDNNNNDGPRTVSYECDGDRDFVARFSGDRDNVRVDTGGKRYELEYTDRNDGRRIYSNNDDVELRVDNDQAYLRIPGESDFEDCGMS